MEKKLFQIPALLVKVETLSDRSVKMVFETQELTQPESLAQLFALKQDQLGWLLFKESEVKEEDIPEYNPESYDEEKSPSQKLRSIMYIFYTQKGGNPDEFNVWYKRAINKYIEEWRAKLT